MDRIRCSRWVPVIVSTALSWWLGGCVQAPPSQALVGSAARGATLTTAYACAGCPEDNMAGGLGPFHGRTTFLPDTISYAANLTPDVTTGLGAWSDLQID